MSPAVRLVVNPVSGRGAGRRLGPRIRRFVQREGLRCKASFSRGHGDIAEQVETAARAGYDPVLIAGGDGSIFEAVNGILRADAGTSLGIVPLGTGNDFSKVAGIPRHWRKACALALSAAPRPVDIGRCNGHFFANGVGAGLDAEIALTARRIRFLRGRAVYVAALLAQLARGVHSHCVTIEYDDVRIEQAVTLIAVSNGQYYGGAFHITPGARIDDGLLDIVIADPVNRLGVLRFAPSVIRGTHLNLPIVRHVRARKLRVLCPAGIAVQADGEIIDRSAKTLDIEILPGRLLLRA